MRSLFSTLALLSVSAIPAAAYADTMDLFTVTGAQTYTFTVPSSPTPSAFAADNFVFRPVTVTSNSGTSQDYLEFFTLPSGGGIQIGVLGDPPPPLFDLSGAQLFSGTTAAPTFVLGSYKLQDFTGANVGVTIESAAVAVTPEPSSFVLLGTGALGLLAAFRRRLA